MYYLIRTLWNRPLLPCSVHKYMNWTYQVVCVKAALEQKLKEVSLCA